MNFRGPRMFLASPHPFHERKPHPSFTLVLLYLIVLTGPRGNPVRGVRMNAGFAIQRELDILNFEVLRRIWDHKIEVCRHLRNIGFIAPFIYSTDT